MVPGSFLIHAKDKDGNPVVMPANPESPSTEMTEVVGDKSADPAGSMDQSAAGDFRGSRFVSLPSTDELSSNVVGLDVYNNDNKNIGKIKDIALNQHGRAQAYILSVGGFLGIGDHYVAVNPSEVKVSYNDSDKKWHATMNATADQLKAAPEFKYNGHWNASKIVIPNPPAGRCRGAILMPEKTSGGAACAASLCKNSIPLFQTPLMQITPFGGSPS